MFQVSPKAKKISLISVFSLMLAVIVGLSVALGIVCNKDKEQWDVVTDEYAYKITYYSIKDTPAAGINLKIKNFTDKYTTYSFSTKLYKKQDNTIVFGYISNFNVIGNNYTYYFDSTNYNDHLSFVTDPFAVCPNDETTFRIGFQDGETVGLIVDHEINFEEYYCSVYDFSIKETDDRVYLY